MYVIYHSSDTFGSVTAVSLVSLLENNKSAESIYILYIEKGMKDETKRKIGEIVERYGRKIEFFTMPNWSERLGITLKSCKDGWLGFGYNRIFLTEILPDNIERVLYLDSDTLIEEDISFLWNIDLDDYYMAGVDDCLSGGYKRLVEITDTAVYCNAGVLLINVKKWREDNLLDTFIEYVTERNGYFVFNEQSILNSVFADKILVLPCKYNTTSLVYTFEYEELMKMRAPDHYSYSKEEYYEARKKPAITHFTGCFYINRRPWTKNSDHPHAKAYDKYYAMTPWKDEPYADEMRSFKAKLGTSLSHMLPKAIMVRIVRFLYTDLRVKFFQKKLANERKG